MVQGKSKGLQQKTASARSAKQSNPKKGQRSIPPKKVAAVKHASLQKSLTAKINKSIERQMVSAASSGKLTIMKYEGNEASGSRPKGDKK